MKQNWALIHSNRHLAGFFTAILLIMSSTSQAQWLTQSFVLQGGWNAVFLHVDASHETLDTLVGSDSSSPILQVWRWNPPSSAQIVASPAEPTGQGTEWSSWVRGQNSLGLQRLVGDSAYLVRLQNNANNYVWNLKGQPVVPRSQWNISGLNFLGFPTDTTNPPNFEDFIASAPELDLQFLQIFQYIGGKLKDNPVQVINYRNTPVTRGRAYWIRSGEVFNRYFGPFEVVLTSTNGVRFGEDLNTYRFRLRNLTADPLTVSLGLAHSEVVPLGQPILTGTPPLLVRGSLNLTNLTYGYSNLTEGNPQSWSLTGRNQLGSEVEVVLGLDRAAMEGSPGDLLAGILQFSDSLAQTRVDIPVSARVAPSIGLWLGGAAITQVGQYLKTYERSGNDLVLDENGQYIVTSINTNLAAVPTPYPLRLIVHNPSSGSAVLLQRAYYGLDESTNTVVATRESALNPSFLKESRRMSAIHLPWSEDNPGWAFNGILGNGATLTANVVTEASDRASNPFLHSYHPDHDNFDAQFKKEVPQGVESYKILRNIALSVTPPEDNFSSRTSGGSTLSGIYSETIRVEGLDRGPNGVDTREFEVRGIFSLNRITDVPILTTQP